jgi:hypothetical protein
MEKLTMACLLPPQFPAFLMQSLQNLPNFHGVTMPRWRLAVNARNALDHRPRARDARLGTETLSRGSVHPACSALLFDNEIIPVFTDSN